MYLKNMNFYWAHFPKFLKIFYKYFVIASNNFQSRKINFFHLVWQNLLSYWIGNITAKSLSAAIKNTSTNEALKAISGPDPIHIHVLYEKWNVPYIANRTVWISPEDATTKSQNAFTASK